jgi:hypothetical protein
MGKSDDASGLDLASADREQQNAVLRALAEQREDISVVLRAVEAISTQVNSTNYGAPPSTFRYALGGNSDAII